jgi:hypothetical protein
VTRNYDNNNNNNNNNNNEKTHTRILEYFSKYSLPLVVARSGD